MPPPPSTEPGLDQGQRGIAFDELTSEELLPIAIRELEKEKTREERLKLERLKDAVEPRLSPPDLGPELPPTPSRYYVVLGRNGGRKGALAARMAVPLTPLPPPPAAPIVSVAENYVEVTWTAPQGLRMPVSRGTALPSPGSLTTAAAAARAGAAAGSGVAVPPMPGTPPMPSPAGVVAPSRSDDEDVDDDDRAVPSAQPSAEPAPPASSQPAATAPVSPSENGASAAAAAGAPSEPGLLNSRSLTGFPITKTGYVIEEVPPPDYVMPVLQPGEVPPLPRRLTLTPLATTSWRDERLEYGTERCYVIRTVESTGPAAVESPPSAPTCVSPKDTFPPAAPASLAAVASEGAVSLIWEANTEADIAGYIVLRGEAPGETLAPLTPSPIKETTFRDTTAKAGVRYVYAVVAVDTATPQNVSPQSNRVEETAR